MEIKLENITEKFVKELCKEPNIKEAFVREGIIEEEKLEVGKWYIRKLNNKCIINYQNNGTGYGFGAIGIYSKGWQLDKNNFKYFRLATPQEVETALKNEAVKRGYKNGVKTKPLWGNKEYWEINEDDVRLSKDMQTLHFGSAVFHKGQFAEIIEETRTIEIPLKDILSTPNNYELGEMVRKLAN